MKKLAILSLLILIFAGCSKRTLIRNYYVLDPISQAKQDVPTVPEPYRVYVDIRDFDVSEAFDNTRIVARAGSHEIRYYFYHHWAVRPSAALADMLFEQLEGRQLFQKLTRGFTANVGYIISGKIFAIERLTTGETDSCHVHLVLELTDERTSVAVVRHEFDRSLPLPDQSMNSFAVQMSQLMTEENNIFIKNVIDFFENRKQRNNGS